MTNDSDRLFLGLVAFLNTKKSALTNCQDTPNFLFINGFALHIAHCKLHIEN